MRQELGAAWRLFGRSFLLFWDELFLMLGLGLLQALATLLILPAPAVAAGLNLVTWRMARKKRVNLDFFKSGVRQYFWMSYKLLGVWALLMGALAFNVWFYAARTQGFARYISFVWLYVALFVLGALPLLLPVMLAMEEPSVWTVYRNTAALLLSAPLYALMLLAQLLALLLLLRYLPFLFFLGWPALLALIGSLGARYLIDRIREGDAFRDDAP